MRDQDFALNVLDVLEDQHVEIAAIIKQLESHAGDRTALVRELVEKLAAHIAIEEQIFYPAVVNSNVSEVLHGSVDEHRAIRRALIDIIALGPNATDDEFSEALSALADHVTRHAYEEQEARLFPSVQHAMTEEQLAALGNEVIAMYEAIVTTELSAPIVAETRMKRAA